jgi:uncharacterized membrane protein YeaQ/YmgE (transglycosylase-associated protein family)
MYRAFWNFIGLAAGWLGGKRLRGDVDYTPSLDGVMGVAGTFIGGVFICVSWISGSARTVLATAVAMICAALLATSVSAGSGRRAIARNS